MADLFPFRQTVIATSLAVIRIPARPPETAQEEKTHMDAPTPTAEAEETSQRPENGEWLQSLPWDEPAPTPVIFHSEPKRDQAELVHAIGARMRQARELCNLSQSAAAKRLGYQNPSKLSKVELATDTNSVPLWLIARAAKLYEVSLDFLFGFTDDWETGVPRGAQPWMLDAWEKARERDMAALVRLHEEIAAVSQYTSELVADASEVTQALYRLRTRVPAFDEEMPASALVVRIERLQENARAAESALKRFHLGLRPAASNGKGA